ncbi:cation:proton antiporter [soil metagenome]
MDSYFISIVIVGLAGLSVAWIPTLLKKINISYALFYLFLGFIIYKLPFQLPWPDPKWNNDLTVRLTELIVIIALMGTGLKIDHPFSFKEWRVPFRLVTITMLLSIGTVAFIGWYWLGFDPASAVLLGAVLAPTDPVLASDVQVGPPLEGKNDEVRFSLTAEAGLNDGMAFPFTWLAVAIAVSLNTGEPWLVEWLWKDLLYRILAGVACGYILGKGIAYLIFKSSKKRNARPRDGFIAISTTLLSYGITELVSGYGFMAVFVTAVVIRNYEIKNEYHKELHRFTDQVERMLLVALLILFGGSLTVGLLDHLTWPMATAGMIFILILRPVSGLAGLAGTGLKKGEKYFISFFGIKGIGSFFYLSFGIKNAEFQFVEELWSLVGFVVLGSIIVHGISASLAIKRIGL